MIFLAILATLVVYVGPPAIGAWIGTRVRHPLVAFALGWIATPVAGFALAFVLEIVVYHIAAALGMLSDPNSSGRGMLFLIMPLVGLFSGLPAGIIAAGVVWRRENTQGVSLASQERMKA